jgi:hypothetical protein
MRRRPALALVLWVASALLLALPMGAAAQEPDPAPAAEAQEESASVGLLVVKGDGSILSRCVPWSEEIRTGYDLIVAAEVDFSSEQAAMGATICSLDGEGCSYPQQGCFCECQGSPCVYWSYWLLRDEGWSYSNQGAANQRVAAGDLQAWVWGAGTSEFATEPPDATLADICAEDASEVSEVSEAAPPAEGVASSSARVEAPAMAAGLPAESPAPTSDEPASVPTWLWLAAAAALPLLALLLLSRRRAQSEPEPDDSPLD